MTNEYLVFSANIARGIEIFSISLICSECIWFPFCLIVQKKNEQKHIQNEVNYNEKQITV